MRLKKFVTAALTMAGVTMMSMTALAGSWHWIDVNGDGVQECYYFTDDGNFLKNTVTPDGYQVNAAGQWTENGVVQTQGTAAAQQTSGLVGLKEGTYQLFPSTNDDMTYLIVVANGTLTMYEPQWGTYEGNGTIFVGNTGYAYPVTYTYAGVDYINDENGDIPVDIYTTQDPNYNHYSTTNTILAADQGYIYDYDSATNMATVSFMPF